MSRSFTPGRWARVIRQGRLSVVGYLSAISTDPETGRDYCRQPFGHGFHFAAQWSSRPARVTAIPLPNRRQKLRSAGAVETSSPAICPFRARVADDDCQDVCLRQHLAAPFVSASAPGPACLAESEPSLVIGPRQLRFAVNAVTPSANFQGNRILSSIGILDASFAIPSTPLDRPSYPS